MPRYSDSYSSNMRRPGEENRQNNLLQSGEWKDWTSTWRKVGSSSQTRHVTMTGTITRGKKRGQAVDVELDLTDHELTQLSMSQEGISSNENVSHEDDLKQAACSCGISAGLHIVLFGIICFPFVLIGAILVSLYFGLLTWQNIFSHFYDERTLCHRILICPLLVIFFPLLIIFMSISIAVYAAFVQISWTYDDWKTEIASFEKGFYGWLCSWLSLESCSPYSVVMLTDPESPVLADSRGGNSSSRAQNQLTQPGSSVSSSAWSGRDPHLVRSLPLSDCSNNGRRESEM